MTAVLLGLLLWLQAALLLPSVDAVESACAFPPPVAAQLAPSSPCARCWSECGDTAKQCASLQVVSGAGRTEMGPVRPAGSSLHASARPLRRFSRPAIGRGSPAGVAAATAPELGGFATIG